MRATEVLQKCLGESLQAIHALRSRMLMRAVEAVIAGRRLTLIDWRVRGRERNGFERR